MAIGIAATRDLWQMVDIVNKRLPEGGQFAHLGWWPGKQLRLYREYRRLFPTGKLLRKAGIYDLLMFSCVALATAILGFPLPVVAFFLVGGGFLTWFQYFKAGS